MLLGNHSKTGTGARDDLLIMCSTGMTGIMEENHLRQGEYDLTREVVETLKSGIITAPAGGTECRT